MLPPLESCEKRESVCHSLEATEYTQKSDITLRASKAFAGTAVVTLGCPLI